MSKCVFKCSKDAKVPPTYKSLTVLSPFSVQILNALSVIGGVNILFPTKGALLDISNKEKARLNCVHISRECLTMGLLQNVEIGSLRGTLEQAIACRETCLQDALSSCNHIFILGYFRGKRVNSKQYIFNVSRPVIILKIGQGKPTMQFVSLQHFFMYRWDFPIPNKTR